MGWQVVGVDVGVPVDDAQTAGELLVSDHWFKPQRRFSKIILYILTARREERQEYRSS